MNTLWPNSAARLGPRCRVISVGPTGARRAQSRDAEHQWDPKREQDYFEVYCLNFDTIPVACYQTSFNYKAISLIKLWQCKDIQRYSALIWPVSNYSISLTNHEKIVNTKSYKCMKLLSSDTATTLFINIVFLKSPPGSSAYLRLCQVFPM